MVWQIHKKTQLTKSQFAESTLKLDNAFGMFKHGYYGYIGFLPPISQGPVCQEHRAINLSCHPESRGKHNSYLIRKCVCAMYSPFRDTIDKTSSKIYLEKQRTVHEWSGLNSTSLS